MGILLQIYNTFHFSCAHIKHMSQSNRTGFHLYNNVCIEVAWCNSIHQCSNAQTFIGSFHKTFHFFGRRYWYDKNISLGDSVLLIESVLLDAILLYFSRWCFSYCMNNFTYSRQIPTIYSWGSPNRKAIITYVLGYESEEWSILLTLNKICCS